MSSSLFSVLLHSNRRESIGLLSLLFQDHKTFHVEEKNELNTTDDVFSDPMKGFIFNQKQGVSFYQLFRWKVNWRKPFAFAKPFTLVCDTSH